MKSQRSARRSTRLLLALGVAFVGGFLLRAMETRVAAQQGAGLILNCVDWVNTQPVQECMGNGGLHVTIPQSQFYLIQGWQFECQSGHISYTGDVLVRFRNFTTGAEWAPSDRWLYRDVYRPDVNTAFAGSCPSMPAVVGYRYYLFVPPPVGDWTVTMEWSTFDPAAWGIDVFTVTVAP